ncbi:GNAT family N-acetyltransferase [Streptantibioticus silvisoli]|uniref:GNAT family protein n=1 Tax=Streptantibioticus silvisoli TaxID=2705255 RepID=A0ABT6VTR5_9ACTN|nr:GNAT family protein [Streptantibioticus silvisoli]MDI5961867.1 GNAT family protein [Streptantibioticus silvisoli]
MEVSYDGGRVVLRGDRVELREQLPPEAARIADGAATDLRWIDGTPCDGTVVAASMVVKAFTTGLYVPGWGVFTIVRAADGLAVGGIGFHGPPREEAVEIGYDLSVTARGAGLATEAVRLLSAWALGQPDVRTVVATTEPGNAPSQAVLNRAGFTRVSDVDGMRVFTLAAPTDV